MRHLYAILFSLKNNTSFYAIFGDQKFKMVKTNSRFG